MAMYLSGRAVVYGLNGSITYAGLAATSQYTASSATATHDAEVKQILYDPATSEPIGYAIGRETILMSLDIFPSSKTTHSRANAAGALELLVIPSKVVLDGFDEGNAAEIDGDYIYEGGAVISYATDQYCKLTLPIKQYRGCEGADATALVLVCS